MRINIQMSLIKWRMFLCLCREDYGELVSATQFWYGQELFRVLHIYPCPAGLAHGHTSPKICDLYRNMDVCCSRSF